MVRYGEGRYHGWMFVYHTITQSHNRQKYCEFCFKHTLIEEVHTIYLSPRSLLTFQTYFNMCPTRPSIPLPPDAVIVCRKGPTSSVLELSVGK